MQRGGMGIHRAHASGRRGQRPMDNAHMPRSARSAIQAPDAPGTGVPALDHALELMQGLGDVRARRMFGGFGLFKDGLMLAIWLGEQLYFKADAQTAPDFDAMDLPPFNYESKGRRSSLSYRLSPPQAHDDAEVMLQWARAAWGCALRAAQGKAQARARSAARGSAKGMANKLAKVGEQAGSPRSASQVSASQDPADWPNLGPRSREMLAQAGLKQWRQVQALGSVRAYVRVKQKVSGASLNLLWALEGALSGRPWQQVALEDRATLLMALEDVQRLEQD
jgi:DNA transformation protein and related proteins